MNSRREMAASSTSSLGVMDCCLARNISGYIRLAAATRIRVDIGISENFSNRRPRT